MMRLIDANVYGLQIGDESVSGLKVADELVGDLGIGGKGGSVAVHTYDVGDLIRLSGIFYDEDGDPIDPTTITLKVKDLAGTTTTYVYGTDPEVVKDRVGHYHADITIDGAGDGFWYYRWESTGTAVTAEEGKFLIKEKNV